MQSLAAPICSLLGAGAFVGPDGKTLPVPENLPNAHMRLFGGAQYHRAMAEFRNGIGNLTCPDISREEIVNACGIDDFHDGVNYTRTACVIAVSKARDVFEPFLHQVWIQDIGIAPHRNLFMTQHTCNNIPDRCTSHVLCCGSQLKPVAARGIAREYFESPYNACFQHLQQRAYPFLVIH